MNISQLLNKKFKKVQKGKSLFWKLYNSIPNINKKETIFLIFPESDKEINYYGLLYLDEFLIKYNLRKAVIITNNNWGVKDLAHYSKKIEKVFVVTCDDVENIVCYYSLYPFMRNIRIVSLDKPDGRRGSNLLGRNALSKEKLIAMGVYFLIPFKKIETKGDML